MNDGALFGLLLATIGLSLVLALTSMAAFGRILADLEYQHLAGLNGVRRIQSHVNLRTHGNRVLLGLVFLVLSVFVLIDMPDLWRTWAARVLLVLLLVAFAASSLVDWRAERQQVALLLKERDLGLHGPPGPQGPAGPQGTVGPQGETGRTGLPGSGEGAAGPAGIQGPVGPQGQVGPAGIQGEPSP